MAFHQAPSIVTRDLIFSYDMGNTKSYQGPATTNLSEGIGMSIYNNVPSDVTAALTATTEQYRGATVWKETLTPTTASGVSYLTAGNNPGIGIVTGGGGGLANRYTGHSIFFKPVFPTHSAPIYTNYSNIAGWQSSTNYESMGDGWYRAHVIWYDTVTRSDGKYWAINPLSATLNTPLVCYWAGPFKEDSNRSTFVSSFAPINRTTNQVLLDQTGNNIITASSLTYASNTSFSFNGSSDFAIFPENSAFNTQTPTVEVWVKTNATSQNGFWFEKGNVNQQYALFQEGSVIQWRLGPLGDLSTTTATYMNTTNWYQVVGTYTSGSRRLYINGVLVNSNATTGTLSTNTNGCSIGVYGGFNGARGYYYNGSIGNVKVYNRALSASEVLQNFNALRGRYGI
jgi:hypothetical protein